MLLRVNRVGALLGSIFFNTWVGLIALLLAVKVGAFVMGRNYQDIYVAWTGIFKGFKWEKLFDVSVYDVLLPIGVGYLIISLIFAAIAATVVYVLVLQIKKKKIFKSL